MKKLLIALLFISSAAYSQHLFYDGITLVAPSVPATPVISHSGATAAGSYSYVIVAQYQYGSLSAPSLAGSTASGAVPLSPSNTNIVTGSPVQGAVCYWIFRTAAGGTGPSGTIGKVQKCGLSPVFVDDGTISGDGTTPVAAATAGMFKLPTGTIFSASGNAFFGNILSSALTSGNCVQAGGSGLLTTITSPCLTAPNSAGEPTVGTGTGFGIYSYTAAGGFAQSQSNINGYFKNVKNYGVLGTGQIRYDCSITVATSDLSCVGYSFTSINNNWRVVFPGAGAAGIPLTATISSTSGGHAALSAPASKTIIVGGLAGVFTYSRGASACTNGTQNVTFTGGGTGTITVSGGVPSGVVTLTGGATTYAPNTAPKTGSIATCTGTAEFFARKTVGGEIAFGPDEQAGFDAATAVGGSLYVPDGVYLHSNVITINSNTKLSCNSWNSILIPADNGLQMLKAYNDENVTIENCRTKSYMVGRTGGNNANAITAAFSNNIKIKSVWTDGTPEVGVNWTGTSHSSITDSKIGYTGADGVYATGGSSFITYANNQAEETGDGAFSCASFTADPSPSTHIEIIGNQAENPHLDGMYLDGCYHSKMAVNNIENPGGHGMVVFLDTGFSSIAPFNDDVIGNTVTNQQAAFASYFASNATAVNFIGNKCYNCGAALINNGSADILFASNEIYNQNQTGGFDVLVDSSTNVTVVGNHLSGMLGPAIGFSNVTTGSISTNDIIGAVGSLSNAVISVVNSSNVTGASNSITGTTGYLFNQVQIAASTNSNVTFIDTKYQAGQFLTNLSGSFSTGILADPTGVSLTAAITGSTSYTYGVTAFQEDGSPTDEITASIVNGFASFDATHFNTLSWTAVPNAVYYQVACKIGCSTPGNVSGKITATSYADKVGVGDGTPSSTENHTGSGYIGGICMSYAPGVVTAKAFYNTTNCASRTSAQMFLQNGSGNTYLNASTQNNFQINNVTKLQMTASDVSPTGAYTLGGSGAFSNVVSKLFTGSSNAVASSATPAFNLALGTYQTNTLTANITSFTVTNITTGGRWCFDFAQNGTGNFTIAGVPSALHGFFTPGLTASKHNVQCLYSPDGTNLYAESVGVINQ